MSKVNRNPAMATSRVQWNPPQNTWIVKFHFEMLRVPRDPDTGKLPHGLAGKRGAEYLALINDCGPDRSSIRYLQGRDENGDKIPKRNADGEIVMRSDWYNYKIGNINALLTEIKRPEYRWTGIPDYANRETEGADPLTDKLMVREVMLAVAMLDSERRVNARKLGGVA